ncbi:MAG: cytochrome c, partial [Acidimicrobiales bacterium]
MTDAADLDGGDLYSRYCASCHQVNGSGIDGAFPALANNQFVTVADPTGAIATVLNGRAGMPRWGDELSDAQIAAILTYVRSSLGDNDARNVTTEDVAE